MNASGSPVPIEPGPEYARSDAAVNVSDPCPPCSVFREGGKEQTVWFDSPVSCCKDQVGPVEELVTRAQPEIGPLMGNSHSCLFSSERVGTLPNVVVCAVVVWHTISSVFD